MKLIETKNGYDLYKGTDEKGREFFNIVPTGTSAPNGGYYNRNTIESIKQVKFNETLGTVKEIKINE